jgi:predicted RecA/RadA family phage recombinase
MAKNFIQSGKVLTIPAPADVDSGGVVIAGEIVGVAQGAAKSGEPVDVATSGVWELPKVAADDVELGAAVYWDEGTKLATVTVTDNARLGTATAAAGDSADTVAVMLIQV